MGALAHVPSMVAGILDYVIQRPALMLATSGFTVVAFFLFMGFYGEFETRKQRDRFILGTLMFAVVLMGVVIGLVFFP